jgi:alkylhydroperoxidase family enzyme
MRIKGIDPETAPANLKPIFERSVERFGRVITPNLVMAHRPEIMLATANLGVAIGSAGVIEGRLKSMASLRAAQMIGCPF